MKWQIRIGEKIISHDKPAYIIAEIGLNHGGSVDMAIKMIAEAKRLKVDAVKFQTYITENFLSKSNSNYDYFKKCEFKMEQWKQIKKACIEYRMHFISTPLCEASADILEELQVDAYKIASMDCYNFHFLSHIVKKNKPIIVSTGMTTIEEMTETYNYLVSKEAIFAFLHCISHYPVKPIELHWQLMKTMMSRFDCPIGFSDHTLGYIFSTIARVQGATIIEKHFTLDKSLSGPDHNMSLDPKELSELVNSIRGYEESYYQYQPLGKRPDREMAQNARRSIFTSCPIKKGEIIDLSKLKFIRPGMGLSPNDLDKILGKAAIKDYEEEAMLTNEDIS